MKSFLTVNLGCKVNAYECDAIANILEDNGYILDENNPDLIVINTCSVTATSDSKSRQKIRRIIKENPNSIICVMGCYSQIAPEEVSAIEGVSIVIGTRYRDRILEYALEFEKNKKQIIKIDNARENSEYENLTVYNFYDNTRAYLKIQDGCNNFCSYCIIPYTRGLVRSKPRETVLKEAQILADKGYKELVLTGIHTGGYGLDFENYRFYDLLKDLINDVKGIKRIRISSIEINELTNEVIELIKSNNIIVNHIHIPIQSGCDKTLKAMNRKYNLAQFEERIKILKDNIEDLSITTDVIVGFPNESDEDFEITYNTLKRIGFSRLHVFPFSSRKGTVASNMKNQIHGDIKKERVNRLILLSKELEKEYYSKHLNKSVEVLFEENKEGYYKGLTTNYLKVRVKSDENVSKCFKQVKLNKIIDVGMDYEIEGEIIDELC
ncbi:MAG: tRNA (N(6)-L-threonylcarbamoyladenosine(37)-C(2))-methylthiotransferase MtaB [Bacilli bacterium]|nr:tRNA (N(6)-L-threonylcarbamoyladenosine(37)-C(2))-methylthiotransferase MtaB [Bacilli bacterium]